MNRTQLARALQAEIEDLALLTAVGLITPEHAAYILQQQQHTCESRSEHMSWKEADIVWVIPPGGSCGNSKR